MDQVIFKQINGTKKIINVILTEPIEKYINIIKTELNLRSNNIKLLYCGQILDQTKTFKSYKIKKDDTIIIFQNVRNEDLLEVSDLPSNEREEDPNIDNIFRITIRPTRSIPYNILVEMLPNIIFNIINLDNIRTRLTNNRELETELYRINYNQIIDNNLLTRREILTETDRENIQSIMTIINESNEENVIRRYIENNRDIVDTINNFFS